MTVRILTGDCRELLASMDPESVDSCVCDPPYHLQSIVKRFANSPRSKATENMATPYGRTGRGFMGQTWDGGDVAFDPATWEAVWRVLKPGAHLVAMGGDRTYHRLVCAIEDAGFEIRGSLAYLYGSGFPKSHNISKAIDKMAGAEREIVKTVSRRDIRNGRGRGRGEGIQAAQREAPIYLDHAITAPATPEAEQWEGWGTALKPAMELICLARKPLSEKNIAANVLQHGTGAINIDGCRVGTDVLAESFEYARKGGENRAMSGPNCPRDAKSPPIGRWPANIIHDGSEEVLAGFPQTDGPGGPARPESIGTGRGTTYLPQKSQGPVYAGETGSAARFFYCAKSSSEERNAGLDSHEIVSIVGKWESADLNLKLRVDTAQSPPRVIAVSGAQCNDASEWNTWLFGSESAGRSLSGCRFTTETAISSITTFKTWSFLARSITSGNIVDAKSATANGGSRAGSADRGTQQATITSAETVFLPGVAPAPSGTPFTISVSAGVSSHPTVKPVALMQWLVRLVTPKGGTVLDPFAGSGSTLIAADLGQFNAIGCELSPEYAAIAERRVRAAAGLFGQVEAA